MIVGIGVDICHINRFRDMIERTPGAAAKVLLPDELALAIPSQAARFAAKEALAKALGAPAGLVWHDAEVVTAASGEPQFQLRGTVQDRADELGVARILLTISHDADIAVAMVVCEG